MGISGVQGRTVSSSGWFKHVWAGKKVVENKAKVVGRGSHIMKKSLCVLS